VNRRLLLQNATNVKVTVIQKKEEKSA